MNKNFSKLILIICKKEVYTITKWNFILGCKSGSIFKSQCNLPYWQAKEEKSYDLNNLCKEKKPTTSGKIQDALITKALWKLGLEELPQLDKKHIPKTFS